MVQNFLTFFNSASNSELIAFLFEKKLIKDRNICQECKKDMVLKDCHNHKIGKSWRCIDGKCKKYLNTISIYNKSFFGNKKLDARMILQIIFYLSTSTLLTDIVRYTKVKYISITKIKNAIQSKINNYYEYNPIRLGGPNCKVQLAEPKLNYNVKSHKGRSPRSPTWALTIVDTTSTPAKGFAQIVERRDKDTLVPIINAVVRPGSHISTDEWASYNDLGNSNNFQHQTVCHKYNFVDPSTGCHTQNVESFNNKIKLDIKKRKGISDEKKADFLNFFLFCDTYKDCAFLKILVSSFALLFIVVCVVSVILWGIKYIMK